MAVKKFALSDGLEVSVYKRRTSRSIRLSIAASGNIRVSIPLWVPYRAGVAFAQSRHDWIRTQRRPPQLLLEGQVIGKNHQLHFRVSARATKVTSRILPEQVVVTHPIKVSPAVSEVQTVAEKAAIRTLRQEANAVLPPRLKQLAAQHGFTYQDVTIKQLSSRWGSCDQHQHIALNLYLMQLPWELIDYVLLHELVHTKHLDHGDKFWVALEAVAPGAKQLRAGIRKHKPVVLR
ncbi:M48 family metallopeptidase [Polaromonas sp.]|nr:M48 family metallopeptidase [Candidatus Saccharibacteria bacterium]